MKVLFTPRDPNPYQSELIAELARLGVEVDYLPERTRSHTFNVALMPVELVRARLTGVTVLHIHWVYRFSLPGAHRWAWLRVAARAWFSLVLVVAWLVGLRVVWTAHNLLPHRQVFDDDVAARARLLRAADAVIAHDPQTLADVGRFGSLPVVTAIIPQGPVREAAGVGHRRHDLGIADRDRVVGMVGRLEEYKGVTDLVEAFVRRPGLDLRLLLAGACPDPVVASRLQALARSDDRVRLRIGHLPDADFGPFLRTLDVAVLPFRAIANSGSAIAALNAGVPLMLPRGGGLDQLPGVGIRRYDDLDEALTWAAGIPGASLADMAGAAKAWSTSWSWADVAERTLSVYRLEASADAPSSLQENSR